MYQKCLNVNFFDQGSIDGKSEVKLEKWHLVAELKLKMLNMQKSDIFNYNPATRWRFWTFTPLFLSMEQYPKEYHSEFLHVEY